MSLSEDSKQSPNAPPAGYSAAQRPFLVQPTQFCTWAAELHALPAGLRQQSPIYGTIAAPVVILAGAADKLDPPDEQAQPLYAALPHAQLVLFKETGHMVHHAHPHNGLAALRQL